MNSLNLCVGIDDNYVWPQCVSLYSAISQTDKNVNVFVAYDPNALSIGSLDLISELCVAAGARVTRLEMQLPQELSTYGHISLTAWSKLLLLDSMQENFIWIDADTIALPGWDAIGYSFSDSELVRAVPTPPMKDGQLDLGSFDNAALISSGLKYFNSGIMALNPRIWRERGFNSSWRTAASQYQELGFQWVDQCVLNFLVKGDYIPLESKFNQIPYRLGRVSAEPKIIHFAGATKPWQWHSKLAFGLGPSRRLYGKYERALQKWVNKKVPQLSLNLRIQKSNACRVYPAILRKIISR